MLTTAGVREELGYEIDDDRGTIASPGKFEGEPWFAAALWDASLEGADLQTGDGETDPLVSWFEVDQNLIAFLDLADPPGPHWPTVETYPQGSWIGVTEDSQGFVRLLTRPTRPTDPIDAIG